MSESSETNLKVIEPIKIDVKTFQDKQEFELFYNSHKNEFENCTTTKLNRMYKIPGYRITRQKEELCLKKDYTKNNKQESDDDHSQRFDELKDEINKIDELKDEINKMIEEVKLNFNSEITKINTRIKKIEKIINQQTETINHLIT